MTREVVDDSKTISDLETAQDYDEAMELSPDKSGDDKLSDAFRVMVYDCLAMTESTIRSRQGRWKNAEQLDRLESVSENADEFDVHLGRPMKDLEEWAGKMNQAIFGANHALVGGTPEDEGDREKAELSMALIEDQLISEAKVKKRALANFRSTGKYGTKFYKVYPDKNVVYSFKQNKEVVPLPDGGEYMKFSNPEEVTQSIDQLRMDPISVYDFRIPETANDIEDASWCGAYSYPTKEEILGRAKRGELNEAKVKQAIKWLDNHRPKNEQKPAVGAAPDLRLGRSETGAHAIEAAKAEGSPNIEEFSCFEWWGDYDIDGDGVAKPCRGVVLVPASENRPVFSTGMHEGCFVVCLQRNPYFHQKKPFVFHPVRKQEGTTYSMSIMDMGARMSRYEDELWTLGLVGGMLEASPPIEYGDAADLDGDELEGFMPGLKLPVAEVGHIKSLDLGRSSNIAASWAGILDQNGSDIVGLGGAKAAPRVAAAGILDEASKEDLRTLMYISDFEEYCWIPAIELAHGFNKQYLTQERAIRALGIRGARARTISTIRPDQVAVDIQFRAEIGRKQKQKVFQAQHLLNHRDRLFMSNAAAAQAGQPEPYDIREVDRRILSDGSGVGDIDAIIKPGQDPQSVLTAHEEHRLFAQGQRPGVALSENKMMHFMAHTRFLQEGRAEEFTPEDKQAITDHIYDTLDELYREFEQNAPGMGQLVAMQLEQGIQGMQSTMPGQGDFYQRSGQSQQQTQGMVSQGGGRGAASPTQSQGSPIFRGPGSSGAASPGGGAANSGQQ